MPSVEVLFYMHNFQRRFCWALSSICQQTGAIPELVINIASFRNNGDPSTEAVIDFYKDKLNITHTVFKESERNIFARASYVKDRQIAGSKCDWIFNPDGDHVYAPNFFNVFLKDIIKHDKCGTCIGSKGKISTKVDATNAIMNAQRSLYIENAYETAKGIPCSDGHDTRVGSHVAFKRSDFINKCGGKYALLNYDHHLFNSGMATRSDKRFRGRMGGTVKCNWPMYIHLDHIRDKEIGFHTEEQR